MMSASLPYDGTRAGLIVSFDIGEIWSAVTFCILEKGKTPAIGPVTRYLGNSVTGADTSVPTTIYYDHKGSVRLIGAETVAPSNLGDAELQRWIKVTGSQFLGNDNEHTLPPKKKSVDVLADFLKYLHKCARRFIEDTRGNGSKFWKIPGVITFVLCHPNGWHSDQIQQMREAASLAGISDVNGSNLQLVTSGEAGLHFCLAGKTLNPADLQGNAIGILDVGSLTTDLTLYSIASAPRRMIEVCEHYHVPKGSLSISSQFETFLKKKLKGSPYGLENEIQNIISYFNGFALNKFKSPDEQLIIKFGTARDNHAHVGIRHGRLRLDGQVMVNLFEPYIQIVADAIRHQNKASTKPLVAIFLVGEFAANDWLFSRIQALPEFRSLRFERSRYPNTGCARGAIASLINSIPPVPWSPETARDLGTPPNSTTSTNTSQSDAERRQLEARIESLETQLRQMSESLTATQSFYEDAIFQEKSFSAFLAEGVGLLQQDADVLRPKRMNTIGNERVRALEEMLDQEHLMAEKSAKEIQELRDLAETRRLELGDFDQTRPKDTVMVEEAVTMIKNLNHEIFQAAAAMTEEETTGAESTADEARQAYETVSTQLGSGVADMLWSLRGDNLPIVLQTALQALMINRARKIVRWWTFDQSSKLERSYVSLYQSIKDSEDAFSTGKWRATTKAHLRKKMEEDSETDEKWLESWFSAGLVDVMVAAGCGVAFSQNHLAQFSKLVDHIVASSLALNKAIGEDILSTDLDPFEVSPGTTFDPQTMRDADQPPNKQNLSSGGYILCMSMLGLKQVGGGVTDQKEVVLLEPAVFLESFVRELKSAG